MNKTITLDLVSATIRFETFVYNSSLNDKYRVSAYAIQIPRSFANFSTAY